MQVACGKCGAKYKLSEKQTAGHAKVQFKCVKCGEATIVDVRPQTAERKTSTVLETQAISPMPSFARGGKTYHGDLSSPDPTLKLPADKTITLAVIAGPSKGTALALTKPRVIIGRSGTDLELDDAEVSRWHCSIEVKDSVIRLRDLDSTNGVYFDEEKVRGAELQNESQFRVGSSVVQVQISPKRA